VHVGVVGRGRLGRALGLSARDAGHDVTLLYRATAAPSSRVTSDGGGAGSDEPLAEAPIDDALDWSAFDLVLLAFDKRAQTLAELQRDPTLRRLPAIPETTVVASVVASMPRPLLEALLPGRRIHPFLTTPAARLPGALAVRPGPGDADRPSPLETVWPALRWIEVDEQDFPSVGGMLVGSAMAAISLVYLRDVLDSLRGASSEDAVGGRSGRLSERDLMEGALDDAKRLLALHEGDGRRAFAAVATPGGLTARLHDQIFARPWTDPRPDSKREE